MHRHTKREGALGKQEPIYYPEPANLTTEPLRGGEAGRGGQAASGKSDAHGEPTHQLRTCLYSLFIDHSTPRQTLGGVCLPPCLSALPPPHNLHGYWTKAPAGLLGREILGHLGTFSRGPSLVGGGGHPASQPIRLSPVSSAPNVARMRKQLD